MVYDEYMHELGAEAGSLNSQRLTPSAALNRLVFQYFVLTPEYQSPAEKSNRSDNLWYILPDNHSYLIFYLFDRGNTLVPKWSIIGPRSTHTIINRRNRPFTFVCSFKPGGIRPFVDIPVNEIRDTSTEASVLFKNYQTAIFEQLTACALQLDISTFVEYFETFLLKSLAGKKDVHPVVRAFCQKYQDPSTPLLLSHVSKELGYSDRQLRNIIHKHIGHSPKMVSQIIRFTSSLLHIQSGDDWASIAYASGYYDQSHMISEYHKMLGSSPEKLFASG